MRWLVVVLGLLLAACNGDDSPAPVPQPQPQPSSVWTVGPIINGVNYSPGVLWEDSAFRFPTAVPGVHGVTRSWGSVGGGTLKLAFQIDGNATFTEVDCGSPNCVPGPGKIRLFLQRCGDDWGGGAKASYRFYSPPLDLVPGDSTLAVRLSPELWTNVNGQQDADGFAAALADLCTAGMGFGGMFAMHGVYANGDAIFTLRSYAIE